MKTNGAGTLTLNGGNTTTGNTYSGGTTVQGGTVLMATPTAVVTGHRNRHRQPLLKAGAGLLDPRLQRPGQTDDSNQYSNQGNGNLSNRQLNNVNTDNGGGDTTAADVVEFYLQPISLGSTNYTTDFEMDSGRQHHRKQRHDERQLRDDLLRRLCGPEPNEPHPRRRRHPVGTAQFHLDRRHRQRPSSLGLCFKTDLATSSPPARGRRPIRTATGTSIGSTNNLSPTGWAIFCQNTFVFATGNGAAAGSGDRTNILLGVLAYNDTSASLTDTQTWSYAGQPVRRRGCRSAMSWTA